MTASADKIKEKKMKRTGLSERARWLALLLIVLAFGYMGLTYGVYHSPSAQEGKYSMIIDGASDATGDSISSTGRALHTFIVKITNTATVTPQCKAGTTVGWVSMNARTSTGIDAYPLADCQKIRAVVSGCSACTVSVQWVGRNRL
jgi:hypothetical protein